MQAVKPGTLEGITVLMTQVQLVDYAGSQIVTLETAEALLNLGAKVVIATCVYDYPIKKEFEKLKGLKVFELASEKLVKFIDNNKIDIAWIHHSIIPQALLEKNNTTTRFIFHHMSPFHPLEYPILHEFEDAAAARILFNSEETKDAIMGTSIFQDAPVEVFNNPAPEKFGLVAKRKYSKQIRKILIVSNHLPTELKDAMNELRDRGIDVKHFGVGRLEYRLIMPSDLLDSDVVITIGKTVQYALLSRLPVYCYDHFGGPGYLSEVNYSLSEKMNFSGRGFETKSANRIVDELISGYVEAVGYSKLFDAGMLQERFTLENRLTKLMLQVHGSSPKKRVPLAARNAYIRLTGILDILIKDSLNLQMLRDRSALEEQKNATLKAALNEQIASRDAMIDMYDQRIQSILRSKSYKIARTVAAPYRLSMKVYVRIRASIARYIRR